MPNFRSSVANIGAEYEPRRWYRNCQGRAHAAMAQQGGLMQTARKQRAEQWAEHQRRRDEVRCGLPCDPPAGGHSCNGKMTTLPSRGRVGGMTGWGPKPVVLWSSTRFQSPKPNICARSEEHTSELQSRPHLVCRLLLEKKKKQHIQSLFHKKKKKKKKKKYKLDKL